VELFTIWKLFRLYQREKPDLVHHFTIKCVLYGSFAAKLAGVRGVINSVTGLGYVFAEGNVLRSMLKALVIQLYRIALRNTAIIFQNTADRDVFLNYRLITPDQAVVIHGSGVDMDRFAPQGVGESTPPLIVFPGRVLWDKGVGEFVEAARQLRSQGVSARFVIVGGPDDGNPSSLTDTQVREWEKEGIVEWWGWREDMQNVFAQASIVCLPTYYEGLPKVLIEAASCACPIVATDIPGCRQVVKHGVNGLLVPIKDPGAVARVLIELLSSVEQRRAMGRQGRDLVMNNFSEEHVVFATLQVYDLVT
jgi:glycosyltransferase involved in cell wall biosynthesis